MTGMSVDADDWLLNNVTLAQRDRTLGIRQSAVSGLEIYPNPTSKTWHINNLKTGTALLLTDLSGRILWQGISKESKLNINAVSFPKGSYILKITLPGGKAEVRKLVKMD